MIYETEGGSRSVLKKNDDDKKSPGSQINLTAVDAVEPPMQTGEAIVVSVSMRGHNRFIFNKSTKDLPDAEVKKIKDEAFKRHADFLTAWSEAIKKKP